MSNTIDCNFISGSTSARKSITIRQAIIAGWTGRDRAALEKHIRELEELGVKRPATTPIFYRVAATRMTTDATIQASGGASSGEVEFALFKDGGKLWVGLGSDHTDREVETYNVTVSKQMCDKPFAPEFWAFDDVAEHWDSLMLRSHIVENGVRTIYQEGPVTSMLPPLDLIGLLEKITKFEDASIMFCGTLAAKGGIRPSPLFEMELHDPVRGRSLKHQYSIVELPILG